MYSFVPQSQYQCLRFSPNMNTASNVTTGGASAFVGLNGNGQLGGTHHYSLNVNTGPMVQTDPKTGYPMASPLGGAGSIHASPRAGGPLLPTAIGGTTNLQSAMSGNSMPGYVHIYACWNKSIPNILTHLSICLSFLLLIINLQVSAPSCGGELTQL